VVDDAPAVVHDDLEMFLFRWYRNALEGRTEPFAQSVTFDRIEPPANAPQSGLWVVIRDNSGVDTSLVTAERDVGISVLGGTREDPSAPLALARLLIALRTRIPGVEADNPVAAVVPTSANGPYLVAEEQQVARAYGTFSLVVVGRPL
jgi:hypothetical protein